MNHHLLLILFTLSCCFAVPFGHNMLQYFQLGLGYINFNHGSFGCTPKSVTLAQQQFTQQMEAYPDKFFRVDYKVIVQQVRERLSKYVNVDKDDLVLIENASGGVNAILKSLRFKKGDKILISNVEYPMTTNTIQYLREIEGIEWVMANMSFPVVSGAQLVTAVQNAIAKNPDIRLALFSHITSVPAIILPLKEMALLCKKANIPVLVDGAHAVGQIPLDIKDLGVDYYVSNGHKWLFSPKGSAFLWVAKDKQKNIVPLVISSSGNTSYVGEFEYTGTRDYTSFCSIGAALDFRSKWGDVEIMNYNHNLAVWSGDYISKRWNTTVLVNNATMIGSLVNIELPTTDDTKASSLQQKLFDGYKMYIVVYKLEGKWYTRLSAQIFLEKSDFIALATNVLTILNN
jgi:selenocysteine lyase/cysteine desulfurase